MDREFLVLTNHPFERNPDIFTDFKVPDNLKKILLNLNVREKDDDYELYILFSDEQIVFKNSLYSFQVKIEILDSMKDFVKEYFEGFKLHISPNLILKSYNDIISITGWLLMEEEKHKILSLDCYIRFPWEWFFCCETSGGYVSYSLQ